ncbi:ATP-dependent DNA ligase [Patescibacteria group bacterium]
MKFSQFAKYLQQLEETSKRLEITSILAELISNLSESEIDKAIYLSLGYLQAEYETKKFNIAEKMMIKSLEKAFSKSGKVENMFKEIGDLGNVAFNINANDLESDFEIVEVHKQLVEIAQLEGTGSQDAKINKLAILLGKSSKLSSKYITRIVLGTTRLGFTELTIADALSQFVVGNKSAKKEIEKKYFVHPDIGLISKLIRSYGLKGLDKISIKTGVPIHAQKAQRIKGGIEETVKKIGDCWAEYKFDGTRAQLHLDKNKKFEVTSKQIDMFSKATKENYLVKTFTRNLEDTTHQHPDIVKAAMVQINAESAILDGEAMGIDKKTGEFLPFQQIMQRKRKHSVKEISEELPLRYYVFDIIYLNGESVMNKPLRERNKILKQIVKKGEVIKIADHLETSNVSELSDFFNKAKAMNLEGLIVKNPTKPYEAGARSYSWVKLKLADEKLIDDSIDAVVLGYYKGRGERSKFGIGGFLIGVYDEVNEKFVTVSKVGTGLKDEDWAFLKKEADKNTVIELPNNVEIPSTYNPDVLIKPSIVVEIGADEISISKTHSANYALRFPRLLYFRTDKKSNQITTLKEIAKLHSMQRRGSYN